MALLDNEAAFVLPIALAEGNIVVLSDAGVV
jgi:hypothetical protein